MSCLFKTIMNQSRFSLLSNTIAESLTDTTRWSVEWQGRLPGRPGESRLVVWVNWEHPAEEPVCKVINFHLDWKLKKDLICIPMKDVDVEFMRVLLKAFRYLLKVVA